MDDITSQYPLRRAPSSDSPSLSLSSQESLVSIPSQAGTLFGLLAPTSLRLHPQVSIPSQAGTLFGLGEIDEAESLAQVSIPSQAGTLFGPGGRTDA